MFYNVIIFKKIPAAVVNSWNYIYYTVDLPNTHKSFAIQHQHNKYIVLTIKLNVAKTHLQPHTHSDNFLFVPISFIIFKYDRFMPTDSDLSLDMF